MEGAQKDLDIKLDKKGAKAEVGLRYSQINMNCQHSSTKGTRI
jgi:hypothetical protein